MTYFTTLSEMANRSSIYKRHEARNERNSVSGNADTPAHAPHVPVDHSIGETLVNLTRRSSIFKTHDVHHAEMNHDPHAGQRRMEANTENNYGSLTDTLANMSQNSSIFRRNTRRNEFFHA